MERPGKTPAGLHRGFRDEDQRRCVADLIVGRLGNERRPDERYSLQTFAAALSHEDGHVDEAGLAGALSCDRLAAVDALITAIRTSYDAIDAWIAITSRPAPLFAAEPRLELSPPAPVPAGADPARAQAAVDAGLDGAAFRLAEWCEHEGDLRRAAALYRLAGESGDVHALYALGRVYWTLDQQEAAQADGSFRLPAWRITEVWQHAADLGLVEAMHAVAMMADPGSGPALRHLRRAAALGHSPSGYALGYEANQRGDRDEAVAWWTKMAAAGGYPPAVQALTLLDVYQAPAAQ